MSQIYKTPMKDFNFYAPTRVVFGRKSEEQLPQLIHQYGGSKVLIHYGGGSARRSGLLDKVEGLLRDAAIPFVELGGVVLIHCSQRLKRALFSAVTKMSISFWLWAEVVLSTLARPLVMVWATKVMYGTFGRGVMCQPHVCLSV